MSRRQSLQKQLNFLWRRLQILQEQAALYGSSVEPRVLIQIEDLQAEIAELEEELAALPEETESPGAEPLRRKRLLYGGAALAGAALLLGVALGLARFPLPPAETPAAVVTPTLTYPDAFPTAALPRRVTVVLHPFVGCEREAEKRKEELVSHPALSALVAEGEVNVEISPKPYTPDAPLPPADVRIWGTCDGGQMIHLALSTADDPLEVYAPTEIAFSENPANPLGRKVALGLILYRRRAYIAAREWLALGATETSPPAATKLALLAGNTFLFQPEFDAEGALKTYNSALPEADELAPYLHNNRGIALLGQGLNEGEMGSAREAFSQAVTLRPDEPIFYFNRAYAYLIGHSPNSIAAAADCEATGQTAVARADALLESAGYACQAEHFLRQYLAEPSAETQARFYDALNGVTLAGWALPHFLRGAMAEAADLQSEAVEQYACYLLLARDGVKLPLEKTRIDIALEAVRPAGKPLERLCPDFPFFSFSALTQLVAFTA